MKLLGSVDIVISPHLSGIVGHGGTPLRDARARVPSSVLCGA